MTEDGYYSALSRVGELFFIDTPSSDEMRELDALIDALGEYEKNVCHGDEDE